MQQLLVEDARVTPPRPRHNADKVYKNAAQRLARSVGEWLEGEEPKGERLENILFELLQDSYDYDGYTLAKALEDDHDWDGVNGELVEILGAAHSDVSSAYDEIQAEWVKANDIKPMFAVGDRLRLPTTVFDSRRDPPMVIATIHRIEERTGYYWLTCPEIDVRYDGPGKAIGPAQYGRTYERVEERYEVLTEKEEVEPCQ